MHWYAHARRRPTRRRPPACRPAARLSRSHCSCWCRSPRPRSPSRASRPTTRRPTAARTPSRARAKLSAWLQSTYPGSGSLGISRSCKDGGVSEHKEGRAFDWAVSVYSARDRAYVADFLAKLFATDAEGNADALARRMGIMYLIWNDHIYSSYYGFKARAYQACKVLSTCGDTLRHRNHVHISLSRAGGDGLTSWYTGATTVPTVPTADAHGRPRRPTPTRPGRRRLPSVPLVPKTRTGILDLRKRPFVTVTLSPDGRGEDNAASSCARATPTRSPPPGSTATAPRRRSRTRPAAGRRRATSWAPYPGNAEARPTAR